MKLYELKITLGGLFEANSKEEVIEKLTPKQINELILIDVQVKFSDPILDLVIGKKNRELKYKKGSNVIDFQSYKERKKLWKSLPY